MEVAHQELHLTHVAVRGDERRDEHARVVVEQVAREPAGGEHERGGRAVDRATRRASGSTASPSTHVPAG